MKKIAAVIILFAALPVLGQTAKVIPLSSQDTAERKSLEDQRAAIEQKIKDFDGRVRRQYTTVLEGDKDASNTYAENSLNGALSVSTYGVMCLNTLPTDAVLPPAAQAAYERCEKDLAAERAKNPPSKQRMYRQGWQNGVIYSEDWKFIVPQEAPRYSLQTGGVYPYCGGISLTNSGTNAGVPLTTGPQ